MIEYIVLQDFFDGKKIHSRGALLRTDEGDEAMQHREKSGLVVSKENLKELERVAKKQQNKQMPELQTKA